MDTLFRRRVRSVDLDGMPASDRLLSAFDVDEIAPEALLFQTGYLTIRDMVVRVERTSDTEWGRAFHAGVPDSNLALPFGSDGTVAGRLTNGTRYDFAVRSDLNTNWSTACATPTTEPRSNLAAPGNVRVTPKASFFNPDNWEVAVTQDGEQVWTSASAVQDTAAWPCE